MRFLFLAVFLSCNLMVWAQSPLSGGVDQRGESKGDLILDMSFENSPVMDILNGLAKPLRLNIAFHESVSSFLIEKKDSILIVGDKISIVENFLQMLGKYGLEYAQVGERTILITLKNKRPASSQAMELLSPESIRGRVLLRQVIDADDRKERGQGSEIFAAKVPKGNGSAFKKSSMDEIFSQEKKFSINFTFVPLDYMVDFLVNEEEKLNLIVVFDDSTKALKKVHPKISLREITVKETLDIVLKMYDLKYDLQGGTLLITRLP
jgi:hypothetical protein